ncbi:MAG: TonB-dependent receptor [Bacteroidota bacterium]
MYTPSVGFFCALLLCVAPRLPGAPAQPDSTGTLSGIVMGRDSTTGVPFATVLLEGTKLGAATNESGAFTLTGVPPGTYTVIARALGYEEWRSGSVEVSPFGTRTIRIILRERAIPLSEIQITAERARRQADIRASTVEVAPVRAKTLAGVAEDVLRTLQSLPGVLAPNDFTSQLVVRGSGPDQNLIIMDDIEVFNPYRLYGLISMFNPETASDINLITGGFPARYGDRLSAVLEVRTREADRSRGFGGSLNASITNANLVLLGGFPFGIPGSFVVSGRRTYYDLILGPIAKNTGLVSGDVAFPNFMDIQGKVMVELSPGQKLVANALFSKDGVQLISGSGRTTPDSVSVTDDTRNDVAGIAWHAMASPILFIRSGVSWYKNTGATEFGGDFIDPALNREKYEGLADTTGVRLFSVEFDSRYEFRKVSAKSEVSLSLPGHIVEAGAGVDALRTSLIWHFRPDDTFRAIMLSRGVAYVEDFVQARDYSRVNVYAQDKVRLGPSLSVQPGIRFDHYDIIRASYVSPRLNISYALDPLTTIRGAWGIYRQSPGYEKLLDQNTFYDLTTAPLGGLKAEKATHYVLGIDRWLDDQWQVRMEGYLKEFDDIIVQDIRQGTVYVTSSIPGNDPRRRDAWTDPVPTIGDSLTTMPVNGATGTSYGIELLLEKKSSRPEDRLSGWVGYAFARADRNRSGLQSPFRFDQRHTVDVVVDYRLSSWLSLGIRWKYGSNFPYTQPVGLKPRIIDAPTSGGVRKVIQVDGAGNVVFDLDRGGEANKYSGRLPPYHRLDLRVTADAEFWGLDWDFYLDVINVYNRTNVLTYRFYANEDLSLGRTEVGMLPLLPTLGFSARF